MKITTTEFAPGRWTAYIEGDMPPYPARADTERAAVGRLKANLKRRLRDREAECRDIRNALCVLFGERPPRNR